MWGTGEVIKGFGGETGGIRDHFENLRVTWEDNIKMDLQ
jgi:hypothetical protein